MGVDPVGGRGGCFPYRSPSQDPQPDTGRLVLANALNDTRALRGKWSGRGDTGGSVSTGKLLGPHNPPPRLQGFSRSGWDVVWIRVLLAGQRSDQTVAAEQAGEGRVGQKASWEVVDWQVGW